MSDASPSRRRFLAMLGVLVGGGAAGGLAWLRTGDVPPPSPTAGSAASSTTVASGSTVTAAVPMTEMTATTTAGSTTAAETTTAGEAVMSAAAQPTPTGGAVETSRLEVICKDAWRAAPVQGQLVEHRIERLTVHHTAVAFGSNAEAPRRVRSYQSYHQENGWPDIAYHYLIDANGHVYEGRPASARGDTFTEYDPTGHFLVCCDGHFDEQSVPTAQLNSLADLLAWASVQFGVDPSTVAGHRDFAATSCPGSRLAELIAGGTLQSMVEQRIAGGGISLGLLCGQPGLDRVAEIEAGW